jgi:hypothetical protein
MKINEDNFMLIAAKHYDMKRAVSVEEFHDDMKRFQYLKRLFRRYEETGELKLRLILNHLIVLYNCLGPIATNMIFFKLKEYHKYLKPFVIFLNYMPEKIEYEDEVIITSNIPLDGKIVEELRKI